MGYRQFQRASEGQKNFITIFELANRFTATLPIQDRHFQRSQNSDQQPYISLRHRLINRENGQSFVLYPKAKKTWNESPETRVIIQPISRLNTAAVKKIRRLLTK